MSMSQRVSRTGADGNEGVEEESDATRAARVVSRSRMESRYPWEMGDEELPSDLVIVFVLGASVS
jgi:hypothetical protein